MTEFVNQHGVIRSFGNLELSGVKDGIATIFQHLRSTTNDNKVTDEVRQASIAVPDDSNIVDLLSEYNDNSRYIDTKGNIVPVVPVMA